MTSVTIVLVLASGAAATEPATGELRALAARIDREARVTRLHPEPQVATVHAMAAQRFAHELAGQIREEPSLRPAGAEVVEAADSLAQAARSAGGEDVRGAAGALEARLHSFEAELSVPGGGR